MLPCIHTSENKALSAWTPSLKLHRPHAEMAVFKLLLNCLYSKINSLTNLVQANKFLQFLSQK